MTPAERVAPIVVTGRSLPALRAALALASVGLPVRVLDHTDLGHLPSYPVRDEPGEIASLFDWYEEGIAAREPWLPQRPAPDGTWQPFPRPNAIGIPAVPLAKDTIRMLGTGPALRAYLDRVQPVLTIGKTQDTATLVRRRLGRSVLERLVRPVLEHRFGAGPESVDVAIAAPGLNEALTRTGSLSGAVLACEERNVARETAYEPRPNWNTGYEALLRRLEHYGVALSDQRIEELERVDRGWLLRLSAGRGSEAPDAERADGAVERVLASALVLDHGRTPCYPEPGVLGEPLAALGAERVRVYADLGMEAAGADRLLRWNTETGAWTCRRRSDGRAELRSPALAADTIAGSADAERLVESALRSGDAPEAARVLAVRTVTAPWTELERQRRAEQRLDAEREREPRLLRVGSALHGDDLSVALHSAAAQATELRRELLGLTAD